MSTFRWDKRLQRNQTIFEHIIRSLYLYISTKNIISRHETVHACNVQDVIAPPSLKILDVVRPRRVAAKRFAAVGRERRIRVLQGMDTHEVSTTEQKMRIVRYEFLAVHQVQQHRRTNTILKRSDYKLEHPN